MSDLEVSSYTVAQILQKIETGAYQVPVFQRGFVWTSQAVADLASSVVKGRPIGMATLWSLGGNNHKLEVHPVQLESIKGQAPLILRGENSTEASLKFAILDGQQRCTAIAMAFGGLRTDDGRLRQTSSRFFLSLDAVEDDTWVVSKTKAEVEKLGLDTDSTALANGLMPLKVEPDAATGAWIFMTSWQQYMDQLQDKTIYQGGKVPEQDQIAARRNRIQQALLGITEVKLATYTVGSSYSLSEICEIFETLNTTGTRVSTVDLIHSALFNDTKEDKEPMLLRDWIDALGSLSGAEGWASTTDRPERVAQMATAAYVGLEKKAPALDHAGKPVSVTSIKAGDLLRTPAEHWRDLREKQDLFASIIGKFQDTVAGARFPRPWCPYPASAAVYVGIAWSRETESIPEDLVWGEPELSRLFQAFFWRNALGGRYDQGFLTKVASDIADLRRVLRMRGEVSKHGMWLEAAKPLLDDILGVDVPSREELTGWIANGNDSGARRLALRLAVRSSCQSDLLSGQEIGYPARQDTEMHHIWPKQWMKDNRIGDLAELFTEAENEGWDRVNCTANLVPLTPESNKEWRAKLPGPALKDHSVKYSTYGNVFATAFIDQPLFGLLDTGGPKEVRAFQESRSQLIADRIIDLMSLNAG